jgi:hypothetical protein
MLPTMPAGPERLSARATEDRYGSDVQLRERTACALPRGGELGPAVGRGAFDQRRGGLGHGSRR